jgi:hypothetical protein
MSLKTTIQRYADVRTNERSMVGILFLQSLLLGFSTSYYFVAANSFFIKQANVADIPLAYIIAGVVGIILVASFKYLLRKFGSITGYISVLLLFALACILLYWGHIQFDAQPQTSLYVAYVGFIIVFPFASLFVLGFSGICLQLFNLSQSKRLLALIGIGEVVASIIGYLTVPLITKLTGNPVYLFLLSALFVVASIFPVLKIFAQHKERFSKMQTSTTSRKFSWKLFTKDQFYISLAVVAFFSVLAIYFTDYAYLVSVRNLASLSGLAIADIIAILFCIIKIGELLFSFFSSNIISTKGMNFSLLLLPFLLLLLSGLAVAAHFIFDDTLIFVIAFFLMAKWSDRVIRKGVYAPSTKVLYQVTNASERLQLQTSIEGTISQFSIVLSGIILLLVSQWQKNNVDNFFYIMSFICLVFSALWIVFVFGLYGGYKKRIHQYLHTIQQVATTVQQHTIAHAFNNWAALQQTVLPEKEMNLLHEIFNKNFTNEDKFTKDQLIELIISYNPTLGNTVDIDEAMMQKRMVRFYFSNDNFFSRLLIIWYLEQTNQLQKFSLITELYEAADFMVRKELIAALNRIDYQPAPNDKFYFTELCRLYVGEIMWAEPAINDIADLEDTSLQNLLEEQINYCKFHLLELLKLLYGKDTIHIVQTVLDEADKGAENQIFAVELLDNILEPVLKEMIIPIFEPIPQQMRWAKLSQQFYIYHLSIEERLKEILLKNFKLINVQVKLEALNNYYQLTKDETILHAFTASHVEELCNKAQQLNSAYFEGVSLAKQKIIEQLQLNGYFKQDLITLFSRYGILVENTTKQTTTNNVGFSKKAFEHVIQLVNSKKQKIDVDIVGLGVLFKLKYANMQD